MRLWRLSTHGTFDGEGARRVGGRWNRPGTAVIYAAATCALATLEFLAHVDRGRVGRPVHAHFADVPDDAAIERVRDDELPAAWASFPAPDALGEIGTRWAASGSTLLLAVPSAVLGVSPSLVPEERNFLINPAHPDFARVRSRLVPIALDPRIRP